MLILIVNGIAMAYMFTVNKKMIEEVHIMDCFMKPSNTSDYIIGKMIVLNDFKIFLNRKERRIIKDHLINLGTEIEI